MGSFGTWKFLFILSLLPKNQCGPCVTLVKICLFKHVVLSCLAQMSNEVKQKKSWLTPFTYAVFLSSPVALCLTTYIFTTNITEELEIRVGLFSSRQCWANLCCILEKISYAKGSARMRLFGPACCSQMLFPTPSAFTPASSRQMNLLPSALDIHLLSLPRSSPTLVVFVASCSKSATVFGKGSQHHFVWKQVLAQQKWAANTSFKRWWVLLTLRDESGILDSFCSGTNLYIKCLYLTLKLD